MRYSPRTYTMIFIVIILALAVPVIMAQEGSGQTSLPLTSDIDYVIQAGDNLETIAALFDVRLACLRETNNLSRLATIRPGDILRISVSCPAYDGSQEVAFPRENAPGRTGADGTYVVRPGDTLDVIAQRLDISLVSLQQANDVTVQNFVPGFVLTIPDDAPPYGQFPAITGPVTSGEGGGQGGGVVDGQLYVIQPGDTLDVIGQRFDVSVVSLRIANDIGQFERIFPGQTLVIPADAVPYGQFPAITGPATSGEGGGQGGGVVDGQLYVIQPGDTLDVIGQRFDVSVVSLRIANDIGQFDRIYPGQTLVIPADAVPYGQFPAITGPVTSDEGGGQGGGVVDGQLYVIQPGDTLDVIGQRFDVSVVSLRVANDIGQFERIYPGQTLVIPADAVPYGQFPALDTPVLSGDGQGGGVVDGELYVVQPGDTLDVIGQRLNVSVVSLRVANNIGRYERIFPGRSLIIPADAAAYGQFPATIPPGGEAGGGVGGGVVDGQIYIIQPLDTLDQVAQQYNVSVRCLVESNGITNTRRIVPGLQVVVPASCPPYGG